MIGCRPVARTYSAVISSVDRARAARRLAPPRDGRERLVVGGRAARSPSPRVSSARARSSNTRDVVFGASGSRRNTLHRDSSAALTANDGFSVVAPISVTVPCSTCGKKRVLLRLVEAMNLVDEEDRPRALS